MVEVRKKKYIYNTVEIQKDPYDLNIRLKILCFIKERESRALETYGAIIQKALGMSDNIYKHTGPLERDGKIVRHFKNGKKFIKLTKQGEDTIKNCFFRMFPSYETEVLLKRFVEYLSSETKQFLKQRRNGLDYVPDRYLSLLNEELLEFFGNKLKKFCRGVEALELEVNCDEN